MRIFILTFFIFTLSCQNNKNQKKEIEQSFISQEILDLEKLIPFNLQNDKYICIWRTGSIFISENVSVLILEKKQLKDKQIESYFITFDYQKPSNYKNCELFKCYKLLLDNKNFIYPLKKKINFNEIDSLILRCNCEGIDANAFFLKEFNSNLISPINYELNTSSISSIERLFSQISKKEHIQTLSLRSKKVDYELAYKIKQNEIEYCINENGGVEIKQRIYGDK